MKKESFDGKYEVVKHASFREPFYIVFQERAARQSEGNNLARKEIRNLERS